jgi:hypothetical protein
MFSNDDDYNEIGMIQVHLDRTSYPKVVFVTNEMIETYVRFMEQLMVKCGNSIKAATPPIRAENFKLDFKLMIYLGYIVIALFSCASTTCSSTINEYRSSFIPKRLFVSGVSPQQLLMAHLFQSFIVVFLEFLVVIAFTLLFMIPGTSFKTAALISLVLISVGLTGNLCGLLISLLANSINLCMYSLVNSSFLMYFVSGKLEWFSFKRQSKTNVLRNVYLFAGVIWPLQGSSRAFQIFAGFFPLGRPIDVLRKIVFNNASINDQSTQMAFMILAIWIAVTFSVSWKLSRKML